MVDGRFANEPYTGLPITAAATLLRVAKSMLELVEEHADDVSVDAAETLDHIIGRCAATIEWDAWEEESNALYGKVGELVWVSIPQRCQQMVGVLYDVTDTYEDAGEAMFVVVSGLRKFVRFSVLDIERYDIKNNVIVLGDANSNYPVPKVEPIVFRLVVS